MSVDIVMGQLLFFCLLALCALMIERLSPLDITLSSLLAGVTFSVLIDVTGFDSGIRAHNLKDIIFFVILPVLVFEAAWHMQPSLLKKWLLPALILAIPGVLLSTAIIAAFMYLGINHAGGFPIIAALLTGAILAATDPVAVVAKLKGLQAPDDLATLIEGESLFNDASAIVLFGVILSFATGQTSSLQASVFLQFAIVFFGGIAVGIIFAAITVWLIRWLASCEAANLVLLSTAFGSFYVAEHLLHVSGIMAVMLSALLSRLLLQRHEESYLAATETTWQWLGLLFNAVLFGLMGLVLSVNMFIDQWFAIVLVIPAVLLARFIAVLSCCWISRLLSTPVSFAWQAILVWGGLRGAVAIALVLSLPTDLPYWWTIQSMVFGLVFFTLLVQGPTTGPLARRLGIV